MAALFVPYIGFYGAAEVKWNGIDASLMLRR